MVLPFVPFPEDPSPLPSNPPVGEVSWTLPPTILTRFHWLTVFGNAHPVELEIGAGDGSFLIQYAARHPERNFLGIERLLGRLRKIDRKARRQGLSNVRGLRLEASYVLRWMIPPGSLTAVHVYFPDPWPKRRHWKRRLVNAEFPQLAALSLLPGGVVYLRTDHVEYAAQMVEVFEAAQQFTRCEAPAELLDVVTDFEADFRRQGIQTIQSAWRLAG